MLRTYTLNGTSFTLVQLAPETLIGHWSLKRVSDDETTDTQHQHRTLQW